MVSYPKSKFPIQFAVADGFGDVFGLDVFAVFEIGDGAGDFADFVMGAGGQVELGNGLFEHHLGLFIEGTMLFDLLVRHRCIGRNCAVKPLLLARACLPDLLAEFF